MQPESEEAMRDYYAELGLNFGASSQDILAAVTAHPQNQEAANVLLNPLKKQVYDQAYFSLHEIGMLRAALGTQSPYWVQEQASFVRTEKQGKSIRTCKQLRRSGRLFWLLLIFLMFANVAVLYLYHDKFPELKNLPVFSFFEEKNNNSATKKSILPEGPWRNDALNNIASYEGKYYKIFDSAQTKSVFNWEEAQKFCQLNYGHLAVIRTIQENNFIVTWIEKKYANYDIYFGLTDKDHEGIWTSGSGEKATFFNWAPGEPNNEFGREHYAMFYHHSPKGKWNDGIPGENFLFICQWNSKENFEKFEQSIGGKAHNIYTITIKSDNNVQKKLLKQENNKSSAENKSSQNKESETRYNIKNPIINKNNLQTDNNTTIGTNESIPTLNSNNNERIKNNIVGTYDGAYQTDQKPVAFTLQVTHEKNKYSAIFEFYPMDLHTKNNTNSGKFKMNVKYDKLTREYVFTGGEWISRPPQGEIVHLRGRLTGNSLTGTVSLNLSNPGWTFSAVKNLSH